jgi:DNA-binding transcriptional MocR family regulator
MTPKEQEAATYMEGTGQRWVAELIRRIAHERDIAVRALENIAKHDTQATALGALRDIEHLKEAAQ